MSDKSPRPRWGLLYLVLPLAGALFWLILRTHAAGAARDVMLVAALVILGGYVEAWRLANTVALLRHPLAGKPGEPIYYVREGRAPAAQGEPGLHARFVTDPYQDLFSMPVYIAEPLGPSLVERPGPAKDAQALAPAATLGRQRLGHAADV